MGVSQIKCVRCNATFTLKYRPQKFCSVTCSNRTNLNNKNKGVLVPQEHSEELAELFGILLGDGSVTKYYTKIYLNRVVDKEYAPFVYSLVSNLFPGASVSSTDRPKRGTVEIQISSCVVSEYLLSIGFHPKVRSVPDWILEEYRYSCATLRGLVDTEGSVAYKFFSGKQGKRFYKQIAFTNSNAMLLRFVEGFLVREGYSPTQNSRKNVYLSNAGSVARYEAEIGSSNPKLSKKLRVKRVRGHTYGGVREWSKRAVLKTARPKGLVGSNPTSSAKTVHVNTH